MKKRERAKGRSCRRGTDRADDLSWGTVFHHAHAHPRHSVHLRNVPLDRWHGIQRRHKATDEMTLPSSQAAHLLDRFLQQRNQAKQRGVEWDLSFMEWIAIWRQSGHLRERGRRRGNYQMCRQGDIGAYCSSNVRIDRMEANIREAHRVRLERQVSTAICSS